MSASDDLMLAATPALGASFSMTNFGCGEHTWVLCHRMVRASDTTSEDPGICATVSTVYAMLKLHRMGASGS